MKDSKTYIDKVMESKDVYMKIKRFCSVAVQEHNS